MASVNLLALAAKLNVPEYNATYLVTAGIAKIPLLASSFQTEEQVVIIGQIICFQG